MWRRTLHQYPELAFVEQRTSRFVMDTLSREGIACRSIAGTGVLAQIEGTLSLPGREHDAVVLRADMDALTIQEETGLPFASFSGRKSGWGAIKYVDGKELGKLDQKQIAESAQRMMAPLSREGGCDPRDISREVQRIMNSVGYVLYLKEDRMRKALELVQGIKQRLRVMSATDMHSAFAANEAASAVLCVELFLHAALERKESRSWFVREDYPGERDEWLKWIVLKNQDGKIDISYEDIPFDTYEFQPKRDDRYDEEV